MPTTLRDARPEDVDNLLALMRAFYAEDGLSYAEPTARAALDALIARPHLGRVRVLDDGDALAGYLVATTGFSLEVGGPFWLVDELFVAPTHRGQGLSSALLDDARDAAALAGARALRLEVHRVNERARSQYLRRGFRAHDRDLMTLVLPSAGGAPTAR